MNFEQFTTCFSSSNKYLIEQYPLQPSLEFISTEKWNNIVLMIVCNIVVIHIISSLLIIPISTVSVMIFLKINFWQKN